MDNWAGAILFTLVSFKAPLNVGVPSVAQGMQPFPDQATCVRVRDRYFETQGFAYMDGKDDVKITRRSDSKKDAVTVVKESLINGFAVTYTCVDTTE